GTPEVTSAHFAGSVLLLVVNQKVYVYDYEANFWTASAAQRTSQFPLLSGIQHPVSHVSGDNCCYGGNSFCMDISNSVFAYLHGDRISQANIYFSTSRGYRFQKYTQERREVPLVISFLAQDRVFFFQAMFSYSDHPLNRSFGLPFGYDRTLDILIAPGQRGILIFWSEKNLLVSRNSGEQGPGLGRGQCKGLFFADQNIWSQDAVLMFTDVGMLEILTPLPDMLFPAFDFQKCLLNIQALLVDPQLQAGICKVELLQGEFENKMYTIDMNSQLELTALMIPRPGTLPVPLVRTLYRFDNIKRPTISTITLDIANKEISCVDLKPLRKRGGGWLDVWVPGGARPCLCPVSHRGAYDPNFQGQQAKEDLKVYYPYEKLGCPLLAYYDIPWKPVPRLYVPCPRWREGKFQEVVEAEYVLLEVNGLFTYTYSLTAGMAGCSAQPQNWTTITEMAGDTASFSWDRENYVSCHDPDYHEPLRWPDVPYQILGGPTENKIVFDQRNGIYIFFISIVDPSYSYCHLETTFSVYVYGAFPLSIFPPEVTIFLLTVATLLFVWLAYMIPQLLHNEQGLEVNGFWVRLYQRCRKSC
ncbi:hypothetical protein MG293_008694, partial [Ovis ammon polii]